MRLEIDPPYNSVDCPIIPLAMVLRTAGRSAGNIIRSLSSFRSSCEYIPLVASAPGLMYFQVGLVRGFIMVGANVSTGFDMSLYQASPRRCIGNARKLQVI